MAGPDDDVPPPALTPDIQYGRVKVNWPALAVIAGVLIALALISWVAALVVGLLLALILVLNNDGTGNWAESSLGDELPKRDKRPRDW